MNNWGFDSFFDSDDLFFRSFDRCDDFFDRGCDCRRSCDFCDFCRRRRRRVIRRRVIRRRVF